MPETTPDPAEWLKTLPPAVQSAMRILVREVAGMSQPEKHAVIGWLHELQTDEHVPPALQHFAQGGGVLVYAAAVYAQNPKEEGHSARAARVEQLSRQLAAFKGYPASRPAE